MTTSRCPDQPLSTRGPDPGTRSGREVDGTRCTPRSVAPMAAGSSVKARTGGGDVHVEMRNDWGKASAGAGDVEVEVSDGLGEDDRGV